MLVHHKMYTIIVAFRIFSMSEQRLIGDVVCVGACGLARVCACFVVEDVSFH